MIKVKYYRVNWSFGAKEGFFVISGKSIQECMSKAYERAKQEGVRVETFQFSCEEEYKESIAISETVDKN